MLPQGTPLGELQMAEVMAYFDGPALVHCVNRAGQAFIGLWIEAVDVADQWLYVPVSEGRLEDIRSGAVTLQDAFRTAEDEIVYRATVPHSGAPANVDAVPAASLAAENLPDAGERLALPTRYLAPITMADVERTANRANADAVGLGIGDPTGEHSSRAWLAGSVLTAFQELVSACAQAARNTATLRGRIPPELLARSELRLVGVGAGSLTLELVAAEQSDFFGDSVISDALDLALDVFNAEADRAKLSEALARVKGRAFGKYRHLIEQLSVADSGVSIMRASPKARRVQQLNLSSDTVRAIAAVVQTIETEETRTVRLFGRLIGLNVRTMYYELQELQTRQKVAGRILESALPDVEHATINAVYLAEIREVTEVEAVTGEERTSRELVRLLPEAAAAAPSAFETGSIG